MILLEYIEDKKYGKVAHFINEKNESVFSRVIKDNDTIIYEELPESEQKRFIDIANKGMDIDYEN